MAIELEQLARKGIKHFCSSCIIRGGEFRTFMRHIGDPDICRQCCDFSEETARLQEQELSANRVRRRLAKKERNRLKKQDKK